MDHKQKEKLKSWLPWFGAGLLLFLVSRLINLTLIPIFTDEAIYVRWGQIALRDAAQRYISLTDGKQPLLIWLFILFQHLPFDVLFSSRLVSVSAGLFSFILIGVISWWLWRDKRRAILTSLLYLIIPFFLFFDRLAIYDSLLAATMMLCLFLTFLLVQTLRLDVAFLFGVAIGLARLTKSSGLFAVYLFPASLILLNWPKKSQDRLRLVIRWLGLAAIAVVISEAMNTILRLSPFYHIIGLKNQTFIVSLAEFIKDPLIRFWGNLRGLSDWLLGFMTWPVIVAIIASLLNAKKHFRQKLFLFTWFIGPFMAIALFGKVIYPRFIVFMALALLPLAADGAVSVFDYLKKKTKRYKVSYLLLAVLIIPLTIDLKLLFKPALANIPATSKNQYISSWPAGGGVKEVVDFLRQKAETGPVFVATEGTFGLMPFALEIYLQTEPRVEVRGYWPVGEVPEEVLIIAQEKPAYFVFYQQKQPPPPNWPLELVAEYPKNEEPYALRLYKVVP
ncbi:phospholipid carrier-dependent glycosyltransferase [Patescibacteria group bacterium]|nr:phospholipid carrier-dependent glycosyltransferase [Patescibacteria group bacterium]MBU1931230.1 phospholipid carrier-dependent glycosyltransferase [Patescibacteria group bacterium]